MEKIAVYWAVSTLMSLGPTILLVPVSLAVDIFCSVAVLVRASFVAGAVCWVGVAAGIDPNLPG